MRFQFEKKNFHRYPFSIAGYHEIAHKKRKKETLQAFSLIGLQNCQSPEEAHFQMLLDPYINHLIKMFLVSASRRI